MINLEKLEALVARHADIEAKMAEGPDAETYVKLASEYSELEPVVAKIKSCLLYTSPSPRDA